MTARSIPPVRLIPMAFALLAAACAWTAPAVAQDGGIAGVWRSQVEGTPSGTRPGVSASDVQTLYLNPNGQYRREIVVEGGDGRRGAGGTIVDAGLWRFTPPQTLEYQRQSWQVCTAAGCHPDQPIGANAGALPFRLTAPGHASFLDLTWTMIR